MATLATRASIAIAIMAVLFALVLFVASGSLAYWAVWVYLVVFSVPIILLTRYQARAAPALLARRMKGGPTAETRPAERVIMLGASLGFLALLVIPALDRRYGWSDVPVYGVFAGDLLVALGYYFI